MNTRRSAPFGSRARAFGALALCALAPVARASTGFTQSGTLGSGDAGKNLANGTVYVVSQDATIERPSTSANSALYVQDGATTVLYIPRFFMYSSITRLFRPTVST